MSDHIQACAKRVLQIIENELPLIGNGCYRMFLPNSQYTYGTPLPIVMTLNRLSENVQALAPAIGAAIANGTYTMEQMHPLIRMGWWREIMSPPCSEPEPTGSVLPKASMDILRELAGTETAKPERLTIDLVNDTVTLDGKQYPLSPGIAGFFGDMCQARGNYVPCPESLRLSPRRNTKTGESMDPVPSALRAVMESKGGPNGGHRLTIYS